MSSVRSVCLKIEDQHHDMHVNYFSFLQLFGCFCVVEMSTVTRR